MNVISIPRSAFWMPKTYVGAFIELNSWEFFYRLSMQHTHPYEGMPRPSSHEMIRNPACDINLKNKG